MIFVYIDQGRCTDGDHYNELRTFTTEEEAREWLAEKRSKGELQYDADIRLIEGQEILRIV